MSCASNSANKNSNGMILTKVTNESDLKYEYYFPPNSCMPTDTGFDASKCPAYPYPLMNIPSCKSIYEPCQGGSTNTSIYTSPGGTVPSELYGDALQMNGGDGMFYSQEFGVNNMKLTNTASNQQFKYIPPFIRQ